MFLFLLKETELVSTKFRNEAIEILFNFPQSAFSLTTTALINCLVLPIQIHHLSFIYIFLPQSRLTTDFSSFIRFNRGSRLQHYPSSLGFLCHFNVPCSPSWCLYYWHNSLSKEFSLLSQPYYSLTFNLLNSRALILIKPFNVALVPPPWAVVIDVDLF